MCLFDYYTQRRMHYEDGRSERDRKKYSETDIESLCREFLRIMKTRNLSLYEFHRTRVRSFFQSKDMSVITYSVFLRRSKRYLEKLPRNKQPAKLTDEHKENRVTVAHTIGADTNWYNGVIFTDEMTLGYEISASNYQQVCTCVFYY